MFEATTQFLAPLVSWIFFASCKSVAIIALVLLCRRLSAGWLSPNGRYSLWFAVVACLTIPFGVSVDFRFASAWRNEMPANLTSSYGEHPINHPQPAPTVVADISPSEYTYSWIPGDSAQHGLPRFSVQQQVAAVWLFVVLALLAVVVRNQLRYVRIKSAARIPDKRVCELLLDCRQEVSLRRTVRILESWRVKSPTMFGWLTPTLLLPPTLTKQLGVDRLRHVFLHELAHVQRHDILVNWLIALVQILHWFNPLVWYALRTMRGDMEQACDARVIGGLESHEQADYGATLIKVSDLKPSPAFLMQGAGIVESHSQLRARINMIAQYKPTTPGRSILVVIALLATTSIAITQAADSQTRQQVVAPKGEEMPAATAKRSELVAQRVAAANDAVAPAPNSNKPAVVKSSIKNDSTRAEYFQINYVNANDLVSLIRAGSGIALLSQRGGVAFDPRTNTLLVNDTDERRAAVRELIATLDVPLRQIQIDARIAVVNGDVSRELFAKAKANSVAIFGSDYDANSELRAIQEQRRGEIISAPRLITDNRKEAMIQQGIEIPDQAKVTLGVRARPTITPDSRIHLFLSLSRDSTGTVVTTSGNGDKPGKDMARINTDVLLNDGQTVVLRGLFQVGKSDRIAQTTGSPNDDKKELLVFLKTKIVAEEAGRNF